MIVLSAMTDTGNRRIKQVNNRNAFFMGLTPLDIFVLSPTVAVQVVAVQVVAVQAAAVQAVAVTVLVQAVAVQAAAVQAVAVTVLVQTVAVQVVVVVVPFFVGLPLHHPSQ